MKCPWAVKGDPVEGLAALNGVDLSQVPVRDLGEVTTSCPACGQEVVFVALWVRRDPEGPWERLPRVAHL